MAEHVVSTTGDDGAAGTPAAPFRTIARGLAELSGPGDVLVVRGGTYPENLHLTGRAGTATSPIRIRGADGEQVFLDGPEPVDTSGRPAGFRVPGSGEWRPASEVDPDAHEDEYVSTSPFPTDEVARVRHGAFLDRPDHTRLISYDRLEDLRADNQRFGRLPLGDTGLDGPGGPVVRRDADGAWVPDTVRPANVPYTRPWTYLGPGLHQGGDGHVHVRLSHTTLATPGIADYGGETDPRGLALALSPYLPPPVRLVTCSHVRLENLHLRFGGNLTVRIEGCRDVVLDHASVWAGAAGVALGGGNRGVRLQHCVLDGGRPPWLFRSDVKDGYTVRRDDGTLVEDGLARGTLDTLLSGAASDRGTVVEHCELVRAHDIALFGQGTSFHHNRVDDVHDDALIVDLDGTRNLDVHHNVITRSLVAISFARATLGGRRRVHRNLIDLREPTASIRPRPEHHLVDADDDLPHDGVYRYGQLYKSNPPDGPMDFFHNTCLLRRQRGLAGFRLFRGRSPGSGVRRSANNVFVDVEPASDAEAGYATALLPDPAFAGPTDATCTVQLGGPPRPVVRYLGFAGGGPGAHPSLDDYRTSDHFAASRAGYPPGFEHAGIDTGPGFRRIAPDGRPRPDDDLRLTAGSPAVGAGVTLDGTTVGIVDPLAEPGPPDLGCYPPGTDSLGLAVGVDGRHEFPPAGA